MVSTRKDRRSIQIGYALVAQLLILLTVANGTPVIAAKILGKTFAYPVDFGTAFCDGERLFGASKTLRGIVLAILLTSASAPLAGFDWTSLAVTPFFKRRWA